MSRPALGPQPVDQVPEVLDVAALVGADGHPLDVLVDGGPDHLVDRAVVAEVDDLGPLGLEEAPHDVDGGVVAVEQAGRGHEPHRVGRTVEVGHRRTASAAVGSWGAGGITSGYYDVVLNCQWDAAGSRDRTALIGAETAFPLGRAWFASPGGAWDAAHSDGVPTDGTWTGEDVSGSRAEARGEVPVRGG